MCRAYIGAGLDPARFWEITARMADMEMRAAEDRARRQRELIWWGAMLPYLKKPIGLEEFAGRETNPIDRAKRFHETWDRIDQALGRKARKRR